MMRLLFPRSGAVALVGVFVVLATVLIPTMDAPRAAAQEAGDVATVELQPLQGIGFEPGLRVPTRAIVRAERAVSGRLLIVDNAEGGATTWEFDIDQAANTTTARTLWLATGFNGLRATATLEADGRRVDEAEINVFPNDGDETALVGTLGLADPPGFVAVDGFDERLTVTRVDNDTALVPHLSTLVADPVTIRELAGTDLGLAIDAWLRGGGQLVVDGPVRSLDDRFHAVPSANPARFMVGAGSVLYDVEWADGLPLGGYLGSSSLRMNVQEQGFGVGSAGELARLAGLALPRPGLITVVLLGYALIAGPVLFLLLSRSRSHRRLWLALPVLSLLAAAGLLVFGFVASGSRTDAHITVVEVGPEGSRATTSLLVGSRLGSTREVTAPGQWEFLGQESSAAPRVIRVRPGGADGLRALVDLPPSSNGSLRLAGPAPGYDGLLRIENIEVGATGLTAEFVNASGADLEGVIAMYGNDRFELGDVAAGESVAFAIDGRRNDGRAMRELLDWPRVRAGWNEWGPNSGIAVPVQDDDGAIEAGSWAAWRVDQGANAVGDHVVGVVGWTDSFESPLGGDVEGNTALFVREAVPSTTDAARWVASTFAPPAFNGPPDFVEDFPVVRERYRFTLAPDGDASQFGVSVGRDAVGLAVLTDDGWLWASSDALRSGDRLELPPGAVIDGEVVVQTLLAEWDRFRTARSTYLEVGPLTSADWSDDRSLAIDDDRFEPEFGFEPPAIVTETFEVELAEPGDVFVEEGFTAREEAHEFEVQLDEGQRVVADLRGIDGDAYLELYRDGDRIGENDDFGGSLDSRLEYTALEAGSVTFRTQGLGRQPLEYEFSLELAE